MEAAVKAFFSSPRFAVAGASSDPSKYGHKVFAWYLSHSLPVTPLNPSSPSISVRGGDYPTVASPLALQNPTETSLSIITPPKITRRVLEEASQAGVPAVWMQPGSFDADVLKYANEAFSGKVVAGDGGGGDEGWCVLVDGAWGLDLAKEERQKL